MKLEDAQASRRARGDQVLEAWVEDRLSLAGLELGTADVSPAARVKLKGIIARLAAKPHPFTTCMSDLREHKPDWSEDRRKKTCNVLKALAGRGSGNQMGLGLSESVCLALDDDVVDLLDRVELGTLELATLTAKKRSNMPASDFVFPKQKRFPIHDRAHAANALARAANTPEYGQVKAKVCSRYADLPACQKGK